MKRSTQFLNEEAARRRTKAIAEAREKAERAHRRAANATNPNVAYRMRRAAAALEAQAQALAKMMGGPDAR